jgi:hypothetical protein
MWSRRAVLLADDENDGVHMNTKASVLRVVLLAALLGTQACNVKWLGAGISPLPEAGVNEGSPSTRRNARSTKGYGLKPVHGKEDPATLIARDGTTLHRGQEKVRVDADRQIRLVHLDRPAPLSRPTAVR